MPKKVVKKKVKKKAKKEKNDDDEEEKPVIEIPPYEDPDVYAPRAKLIIQLAAPISQKLAFTTEMRLTNRVEDIR